MDINSDFVGARLLLFGSKKKRAEAEAFLAEFDKSLDDSPNLKSTINTSLYMIERLHGKATVSTLLPILVTVISAIQLAHEEEIANLANQVNRLKEDLEDSGDEVDLTGSPWEGLNL